MFADSLKMLALERVRGKFFTRAWGKFLPLFAQLPFILFITDSLRFHQRSGIDSGSDINSINGISQRRFTDFGQGRLLHLLGTLGDFSCAYVLCRLPEKFHKVLDKWVSLQINLFRNGIPIKNEF